MTASVPPVRITLLHVPDCPLLDTARATLGQALVTANVEATIEEVEGPFASPTLLVDGRDVTGNRSANTASCRLDLPTEAQVLAALRAALPG
jgi:hypothetical protein